MSKGKFYSGTSGVVLPVRNKTELPADYKDKSRLAYYSSLFNSLEVNSSFYKLPMGSTVNKWAAETGDNFNFTFKLWRNITHNKNMQFADDDVEKFMEVIGNAGDKKGCLLIQFPASIKAENRYALDHLLGEVTRNNKEWSIAIEFRDHGWYCDEVYEILEKYHACIVIHDMPKSATPINAGMKANFKYVRFHGPGGRYGGSYDDNFLQDYASLIEEWLADGDDVYAYFNNTMGDAVKNLATLNDYINGRG